MTTSKPYHGRSTPVAFGKPTIGPRAYVARGTSGWPETFDRKTADKALIAFFDPVDVNDVMDAFQAHVQLENGGEEETWGDVTSYITKITGTASKMIPPIVAVAFWAHFQMFEQTQGAN